MSRFYGVIEAGCVDSDGIQGGDSSGTDSVHASSAGHYDPTHHAHHPEPVNEELGVSLFAFREPLHQTKRELIYSSVPARTLHHNCSSSPFLRRLQILALLIQRPCLGG